MSTPKTATPAKKTKKKLSAPQKFGAVVIGTLQAAYAFLAFWDLWNRNEKGVKGPKWAWIPVILVNWIGPSSYFLFGIKR